ncbi:MAG: glycerol kinase GlpK [Bacillota bacterium]
MAGYILALDQGTTSCRAVLFNEHGHMVGMAQKELTQIYPQPGWVEHDPEEIWHIQVEVCRKVLHRYSVSPTDVRALGITNQRETTVIWDKASGQPVFNAIVWQCRRTAELCRRLQEQGLEDQVREKTGLLIDAYFSATKVQWILDQDPSLKVKANRGELLFGTVDTWLIWKLTGGRLHITDYSNASRTMLYNIHNLDWDDELLYNLDIPRAMLPETVPSCGVYGKSDPDLLGAAIPICGIAGDQQAALFGQGCFSQGMAKNTYGTGCFLLMHTGERPVLSQNGLLTTIAWGINGKVEYALEGSVFTGGAAVQWLRDGLGLITTAAETESLARSVPDTGGVYFVPAFTGLGAPYWDMAARGTLLGLTRGSRREHLVRATLEAIAYQTRDVLEAMAADAGQELQALRVDGGATANNFLMEFQAGILGVSVERAAVQETTALGAAYMAGIASGIWPDREAVSEKWQLGHRFRPAMTPEERQERYSQWHKAVNRSRYWAE